jgi:hypothetical protein
MRAHLPAPRRAGVCHAFRPSLIALFGCVALSLVAARPATAAFVGGVEQFNGTTKDPATWDEYNTFMSDNALTQNDAINFRFVLPPSPFPGSVHSDYTARTAAVGVGQGASVDVRINTATAPISASFYLTDNTDGPGQSVTDDDNFLVLFLDQQDAGAARVGRGSNGRSSGIGNISGNFPLTPGAQYTLQIARPGPDTATFSVFDAAGTLLGSDTVNVSGLPATLYPAFGVSGINIPRTTDYSIDFDNVRIVPEPAAAGLLGGLLCTLLLAGRRPRLRPQLADLSRVGRPLPRRRPKGRVMARIGGSPPFATLGAARAQNLWYCGGTCTIRSSSARPPTACAVLHAVTATALASPRLRPVRVLSFCQSLTAPPGGR